MQRKTVAVYIMPVKFKIDFRDTTVNVKGYHWLSTFYLQELINLKEACKYNLLSDCDGLLLNPVKSRL